MSVGNEHVCRKCYMSVNWNLNAPIDRNKQQVVVMRSVLVHIGDKQI